MEGRILVVHANELILDVVQEMLQNTGYAVTLATDGHRALSKAMSGRYNLIIVDRNLTGAPDGVRLVELLRRYGIRAPIIGTAPEAAWEAPSASSLAEVDHILPSPFDYGELIQAVDTLLNRTHAPSLPGKASAPPPVAPPVAPPELPAVTREIAQPARAPAPARRTAEVKRWEPRRITKREGPPRVLLIDSNDADGQVVARHLTEMGYDVTAFCGGQDAYEATMLNDYELILTDIWLVGMDGFEMIEAMRKSGVTTPIAVRTSYITRKMVPELLRWRICKILLKSGNMQDLLSFVRQTAAS